MTTRQKIKVTDIQNLINLVKAQPALYDSSLKKLNDKHFIEDCWKSIGKRLQCKASECRIKWTVLRNSYSRSLRKNVKKPWYLADTMSFLKNHMRLSDKDTALKGRVSPQSEYENQSLHRLESNDMSWEMHERLSQKSPKQGCIEYSSHSPNKDDETLQADPLTAEEDDVVEEKPCIGFDEAFLDPQNNGNVHISSPKDTGFPPSNKHEILSKMTEEEINDDGDMLFLKSMYKDLSKLSSKRKRRFKIEMMTLFFKHLDEEEGIVVNMNAGLWSVFVN